METLQQIADYIINSDSFLNQLSYNSDFYGFFFGVDLFILIIHIIFTVKHWKGITRAINIAFVIFLISKVSVYNTYIGLVEYEDKMIDGINILWGISMLTTTIVSSLVPILTKKIELKCKNILAK